MSIVSDNDDMPHVYTLRTTLILLVGLMDKIAKPKRLQYLIINLLKIKRWNRIYYLKQQL